MAAITGLARLLATTGDTAFVSSTWPDWRASLLWVVGRVQQGSGLGVFRETVFFTNPLFLDVTCGVTMNAFAFAALSDGAAIASALGFEADAALFGAAAAALRAAIVARAFNESAGAFNAAVLADSAAFPDLFWAGPPSAAALAPNALANYVALAKGVLDNDAPRAARAVQFIMAGDSGGVVAAAGAPMTSIQLLAALYGYGASAAADKAALDVIRLNWALMVANDDVGTLFEFFDDSGEVSHNMGAAPLPFLLERVLGVMTTLPLSPTHRRVSIEPHLGDLAAALGVAVTEFGPVGVAWSLVGGAWASARRAVSLELNASIAEQLPVPARSPGLRGAAPAAAAVVVAIALPLSDAATPPPSDTRLLLPYCLALGGAPPLNVTKAVASGALTLDADLRYLRFEWPVALDGRGVRGEREPQWLGSPPLRGLAATASLAALLSAPAGGC